MKLKASSIKTNIDAQYKVLFPEFPKSGAISFVEADFDVYTNGPIDVEACSPQDVIQSNVKMIETMFLPKLTVA